VRQHGNLSYIRTYQTGHAIPAYQPETAYKVFTRALFNFDIATGTKPTGAGTNYTSPGREVPDVQLEAKQGGLSYCYTYDAGSCYEWQVDMIQNGTAEICNWLFVDKNTTQMFPDVIAKCRADRTAGGNGTPDTSNAKPKYIARPFEGDATSMKDVGRTAALLFVVMVAWGLVM
jgi:hypothetical protein